MRLSLLRANSQLSEEERAVEAFMRTNAPARAAHYEALQVHAEAVWRQAAASDAAVAAVAKVRGVCCSGFACSWLHAHGI